MAERRLETIKNSAWLARRTRTVDEVDSDVAVIVDDLWFVLTELERTEGDLAVAVHEATKARTVLAAVEAALASSEQNVWKVAYAQQHIIDAYHVAAPVQPEEPDHA